jgi:hypothetical protein
MEEMKMRPIYRHVLALAAILLLAGATVDPTEAAWITVYNNDFQTSVGSEWTSSSGNPLIISTTSSGRKFLGEDSYYGINNDTVSLSLSGLPAHTQVRITFDLYVLQTWDGLSSYGPEPWELSIAGGPNIIRTTFSNVDPGYSYTRQSYPGPYPGGINPPRTGASEINTLGYPFGGDSVYHLSFEVPHSASSVLFQFTASGLQGISDESWGLDNVRVQVVPLPPSLLLLGSGLIGLAVVRRRERLGK